MTPEAFARAFSDEKLQLLKGYFATKNETAVAIKIEKMGLETAQKSGFRRLLK